MEYPKAQLWDATCYECGSHYNQDGTGHKKTCSKYKDKLNPVKE